MYSLIIITVLSLLSIEQTFLLPIDEVESSTISVPEVKDVTLSSYSSLVDELSINQVATDSPSSTYSVGNPVSNDNLNDNLVVTSNDVQAESDTENVIFQPTTIWPSYKLASKIHN